jgi:uncharacterized protein (TIGR03663 family)
MKLWKAAFLLSLIAGTWIRFADIGLKPLHHDEGVNSHFLLNLANYNNYSYDPENYHGPTLYYFSLLFLKLFGEIDLALRFWPAACGVAAIALLWWLRTDIGERGAAIAAAFMAFSPGLVYFSRDFIHEMSFVFFTLAAVACGRSYLREREFIWLALTSLSLGLLFATKETAIITAIVVLLAAVCAIVADAMRSRLRADITLKGRIATDIRRLVPPTHLLLGALVLFITVNVLFYSSFFRNWKGVPDAVRSLVLWAPRSGGDHVHAFDYYLGILVKLELPLLVAGVAAGIVIVLRGSRFALFLGAWTAGIFLAYSLIPYKTPWLIINILLPLTLTAGAGIGEMLGWLKHLLPRIVIGALTLIAIISSFQMCRVINFEAYDDNDNKNAYLVSYGKRIGWRPYRDGQYGYVYAQTERELLNLVSAVDEEADRMGTREATNIYIASPAYWPLPWYLRRYKGAAFTGNLPQNTGISEISQPLMIANQSQVADIEAAGGWRQTTPSMALRPGERLVLFVRVSR